MADRADVAAVSTISYTKAGMSLTFISLRLVLCAIELLPFAEPRPEQAAAASSVNSQKITTQAQVRSLKPQILGPFGDAALHLLLPA